MLATIELVRVTTMSPAAALSMNWETYRRVLEAQLTISGPAESKGYRDSQELQI